MILNNHRFILQLYGIPESVWCYSLTVRYPFGAESEHTYSLGVSGSSFHKESCNSYHDARLGTYCFSRNEAML